MGKKSRRNSDQAGLNITSMMDMMTIILVFLLKSYSTEDVSVAPSDDLVIPISSATAPPKLAVNVVITRHDILVDGERLVSLSETVDPTTGQTVTIVPAEARKGPMISALFDRLHEKAETAKDLGAKSNNESMAFKGEILLQCDKHLPFSVVRDVMFTAGQAQFSKFRFVVLSKNG